MLVRLRPDLGNPRQSERRSSMKVMKLSKDHGIPGTYGGPLQLNLMLGDIKLKHENWPEEYILSLRDEVWVICLPRPENGDRPNYTGTFELGLAKASIIQSLDTGGRLMLKIAIESADVADFIDLFNTIYIRLGVPHEVIPTPKRRLEDISFIRGVRNDLRSFGKFLKNRWRLLQESAKLRVFGKTA